MDGLLNRWMLMKILNGWMDGWMDGYKGDGK